MKRAIVCGGRDVTLTTEGFLRLDDTLKAHEVTHVITGGASGIDEAAQRWARAIRLQTTCVQAEWEKYGKSAGPIRNKQMLEMLEPGDIVIAFTGGKGTQNMVDLANRAGFTTIQLSGPYTKITVRT